MSTTLQAKPIEAPTRSTGRHAATDSARPYRGRRLTWGEFYELRPDLQPANDNISTSLPSRNVESR